MDIDLGASDLWERLLDSIKHPVLDKERQLDKQYCFCHGVTGSLYRPGGIVAIGRAPNGWSCEWSLVDLRNPQKHAEIVKDIVTSNVCQRDKQIKGDGKCTPMHWLEHRYPRRQGGRALKNSSTCHVFSAVKKIVHRLIPLEDKEPWEEHLTWQNLYAFSNGRGNPSSIMMDAQRDASAALLRHSLDCWRPKTALFFTETNVRNGSPPDWWSRPFLKPLGISDFQVVNKRHLISRGKLPPDGTAYFLTRPDAPGIPGDDYVKRVLHDLKEAGLE